MSLVYICILGLGNSTIVNHCYNSWSTTVTTVVLFTIVMVVDMICEWIFTDYRAHFMLSMFSLHVDIIIVTYLHIKIQYLF